ncbi:MAG: hypothetical protein Q9174_003433 [Haloplaca sp. 1 TL-2023]
MVVLLDLDDASDDDAFDPYARPKGLFGVQQKSVIIVEEDDGDAKERATGLERPNPNINGFSAALGCYPDLAKADTYYRRIWEWRTKYTSDVGGIGTGIGEGNEGVECYRGEKCMATHEVQHEFVPPEMDAMNDRESSDSSSETPWTRPKEKLERAGDWQQEIEGIGGRMKKKYKQSTKVGKPVKEWEDERAGKEDVLGREFRGEARSWCGWCGRVIWGKKDRQIYGEKTGM